MTQKMDSSGAKLAEKAGQLLLRRGLTLSTAESCTGGLVGHWLTNIPGSSEYYAGGVVSYSNEVKIGLVGVRPQTIADHGAVSEETAMEMAAGIKDRLETDLGVSVTGIAGPGGATETKPVGLTWVGISTPEGTFARKFIWKQDRVGNKKESARAVLALVIEYLDKK